MFEIIFLMCSWLPSPLSVILFGAISIALLIVIVKLIAKIIDLIPFI